MPPDFERDDERLRTLLGSLPPSGPRFAIEFRHASWLDDNVLSELKNYNVACVAGDAEGEVPQNFDTADFIYARLRRPSYSNEELEAWNEWFQELQANKKDILVYLKHDETGEAPQQIVSRWS